MSVSSDLLYYNNIDGNYIESIRHTIVDKTINDVLSVYRSVCSNLNNRSIDVDDPNIISYHSSLRGRIWQLLLAPCTSYRSITLYQQYSSEYIELCELGSHPVKYEKIRVDSARTFPQDPSYNAAVDCKSLIRLLNAFTHKNNNNHATQSFTYIQGMNTLAATFLYVLNELDAYYMFSELLCVYIPLYYQSSHIGVNAGCKLVDEILRECDAELYSKLLVQHELQAYIYAFSAVSSLCTSVLPLDAAVIVWDWLLAAKCPALNIVCVAAQLIMTRDKLLSSTQPKSILDYRVWPQSSASDIIRYSNKLIATLNNTNPVLLHDIVHHATDVNVSEKHAGRKFH